MVDEFGAFGMDWAAFSRELVDRNALSRTRRRGAVARIRCTVRAIMTRNMSGPRAGGAAPGAATGSARPILPDR